MTYNLSQLPERGAHYYISRYGIWMKPDVPYKSTRRDKKGMVLARKGKKAKIVHFGQKGYSDFTKHKDNERRKRYLARSAGIRDKHGRLTARNKWSANYWARKVLW